MSASSCRIGSADRFLAPASTSRLSNSDSTPSVGPRLGPELGTRPGGGDHLEKRADLPRCAQELRERDARALLRRTLAQNPETRRPGGDVAVRPAGEGAGRGVHGVRHRAEAGGLSGRPLFRRSTEQLRRFYRLTGGALPLIGTGGILCGADAYAKVRAGASALQLYTALVYRGPRAVLGILGELDRRLEQDGCTRLGDLCGVDAGL